MDEKTLKNRQTARMLEPKAYKKMMDAIDEVDDLTCCIEEQTEVGEFGFGKDESAGIRYLADDLTKAARKLRVVANCMDKIEEARLAHNKELDYVSWNE